MKAKVPIELIAEPLEAAWKAVDAMWKIELLGDAELIQLWRVARNKLGEARQRFIDLQKLADYIRRNGNVSDCTQPAQSFAPTELQTHRKKAGSPSKIQRRSEARAP